MKHDAPGVVLSNASATSANFQLSGGRFGVTVLATTLDYTNYLSLQVLGADGSTWLDLKQTAVDDATGPTPGSEIDVIIGRFHANGMKVFDLPLGIYRFLETGALTAIYAAVARADF